MNETSPQAGEQKQGGGWLAWVGLAVLALWGIRTIGHSSIWLRLATGRAIAEQGIPRADAFTFTAAGLPWVNTSWLYDRLLYGLWNLGGAALVTLLHAAFVVLAFGLLIRPARRLAGPVGTALALLGCAWLLSVRFVVSPVLPSLLFAALFIRVLSESPRAWMPVTLLPVQWLWANVHGSFVLGPILFLLFAIERWHGNRESQDKKAVGWAAAMIPAALVVSLLNPFGAAVFTQTFRDWSLVVFAYVQEWISPFSLQFQRAFFVKNIVTLALLIGAIGLITEKRKLPIAMTSLAVLGAFLVVRSLRHVEFFALLAFPFLALSGSAAGAYLGDRVRPALGTRAAWWSRAGALLVLLLAAGSAAAVLSNHFYESVGSPSVTGFGVASGLYPEKAAEILAKPGFPAKTVHLFQDGNFLLWAAPGRPVFVDQRADLHAPEFFEAVARSLNGEAEAWDALEKKWEPESVLLNGCALGAGPLLRMLLESRRWALAYLDGTSALLIRPTAANQAWLSNEEIQKAGLLVLEQERREYQRRMACCARPVVSPRLIGAGTFYLALDRFPEAELVYDLLTRGSPAMVSAWYSLGMVRMQLGKFDLAATALEQACRRRPRDPMFWLQLGRAYAGAGMAQDAERAFEKGRKLNPALAERFRSGMEAPAAP
ncbi:MAG TPA: tetratricopeptide repeat protein [Kiritimatiellia bacterium]|nr:tetratricopeptide repeat protein [Kiritimatiellia bacterium]HRZ11602.1 tetratricopeptide repeat protein [Kiritimatiellia bacterium]HSA16847.1 tetratricopeptide repeat protein [Kiritimatiellia bacterium]